MVDLFVIHHQVREIHWHRIALSITTIVKTHCYVQSNSPSQVDSAIDHVTIPTSLASFLPPSSYLPQSTNYKSKSKLLSLEVNHNTQVPLPSTIVWKFNVPPKFINQIFACLHYAIRSQHPSKFINSKVKSIATLHYVFVRI